MAHLNSIFKDIAPHAAIYHRHFNLLGLPGWVFNGLILKTKNFNENQIKIFEAICPYIRGLDDFAHKVLRLPLGQSLLHVVTI